MKQSAVIRTQLFTLLAALIFAVGCGDTSPDDGELLEPDFGKQDSLRAVQDQGWLPFDTPVAGAFDEDFQFFGYQLRAVAGSVVSVEVTQRGSSRELDTTLIVYGAQSKFNPSWERIAYDRDSGWGTLSRIRGLELSGYENYLVVVSTSDAMGRGDYRLMLTCDGDNCVDTDRPDFSGCSDEIFELVDACVDEMVNTGNPQDDEDAEYAIEFCVNERGAVDLQSWVCEGEPDEPGFCLATEQEVLDGASACEGRLGENYGIFPTVPLSRLDLSETLRAVIDDWIAPEEDYLQDYRREVESWSVPAGTTTEEIVGTVITTHERREHLSAEEAQTRSEYEGDYFSPDLITAIEAEYGQDYSATEITGNYTVAAGSEEWLIAHVVHFADQDIAFVITEILVEE